MKGLKVIPLFLLLIGLTYLGMWFVELNRDEVVISFGGHQSPPTAIGFVVLTSVFFGMVVCGALCSVELLALHLQNRKLKRRLIASTRSDRKEAVDSAPSTEIVAPRTSGRFT